MYTNFSACARLPPKVLIKLVEAPVGNVLSSTYGIHFALSPPRSSGGKCVQLSQAGTIILTSFYQTQPYVRADSSIIPQFKWYHHLQLGTLDPSSWYYHYRKSLQINIEPCHA